MTRSGNSLLILWICYMSLVMKMSLAHNYDDDYDFWPLLAHDNTIKRNITPLFVFGDSLLDSGNNNYINTTMKAIYKPYGMTYFHKPTGRFSDGRTMADFIANFANLSFIHPYLENVNKPSLDGVNFASAGAGAQDHINKKNVVIPLKQQVESFKKVKLALTNRLGNKEAKKLISKAVYLFSIGGNDILSLFIFPNGTQIFQKVSFEQYTNFIVGNLTTNLKELYSEGGRKFAFLGIDALGCRTIMRKKNFDQGIEGCHENTTKLAQLFNKALLQDLEKLSKELQGFKYSYLDAYTIMDNILSNPSKYGLKEVIKACCGRGEFGEIPSCGGHRSKEIGSEFTLCDNPQDYLYFDSAHFSEKTNEILAKSFWNGPATIPGSYTLQQLFSTC